MEEPCLKTATEPYCPLDGRRDFGPEYSAIYTKIAITGFKDRVLPTNAEILFIKIISGRTLPRFL